MYYDDNNNKFKQNRLEKNNITIVGLKTLFKTLAPHTNIKILNVNKNQLDGDCLDSLCNFLSTNKSLEQLHIGIDTKSSIEFADTKYKKDVIGVNKPLLIFLSNSDLSVLANSLFGNTTLCFLGLENHRNITKDSLPTLHELANSTFLTEIQLAGTSIYFDDIKMITANLKTPIEDREIPIVSKTKSAAKYTI